MIAGMAVFKPFRRSIVFLARGIIGFGLSLGLGAFSTDPAGAQSIIQVGNSTAVAGARTDISIQLSADTHQSGLNARLQFDPAALSVIEVRRGELLDSSHSSAWHEPQPGRLNLAAFGSLNGETFTNSSGTAFILTFAVSTTANPGDYPIAITTSGPTLLSGSGLSTANGTSVAHTQSGGRITVMPPSTGDVNQDGVTDYRDVLFFSGEWHSVPTPGNSILNPVVTLPVDLIDQLDLLELYKSWQK